MGRCGVEEDVGQDDAFAAFYRAELDGQVRRAYLLLGSDEQANDVVHDAFVAVYRRWGRLREPGPYLNRAVLNRCRDVGRRRGRDQRLLPRLVGVPAGAAVGTESAADLDDVLARLPFNQRAAVVLRYFGQLTTAEIAAALGCRPGSVGPWIHRALLQMREELA